MSRITQQTFDDAVKENIEEFSMTADEAVQNAIEQFESQGVNLQNIITNFLATNEVESITLKVKKLILTLEKYTGNFDEIVSNLYEVKQECNDNIAKRVLIGQCGLYDALINFLIKNEPVDSKLQILIFEVLISLMTGYPDLFDDNGFNIIVNTLKNVLNEEILILTLKWSIECCIKHENNRVKFLSNEEFVNSLKNIMQKKEISSDILKNLCRLFQTLVLNDDIRAEIPSAHKHACLICEEFLKPLILRLQYSNTDKKAVVAILQALISIIVRNEFCQTFFESSGLEILNSLLLKYPDDEVICRSCITLIKVVSGNDQVKDKVFNIIDSSVIIFTVQKFLNSPKTCSQGLACLSMLSLRNANNSKILRENNIAELVVQAMKTHSSTKALLKSCCWLIKNLNQGNQQFALDFLNLGAEDCLRDILKNHEDCTFEINLALKHLGCEAEFRELWTGEGESMSNK